MAYDESVAVRVRASLAGRSSIDERKMFGGPAFVLSGNMCCCVTKHGLMVRVGPDAYEDALAKPHAGVMDRTGRPMRGMGAGAARGFGVRCRVIPMGGAGRGIRGDVPGEIAGWSALVAGGGGGGGDVFRRYYDLAIVAMNMVIEGPDGRQQLLMTPIVLFAGSLEHLQRFLTQPLDGILCCLTQPLHGFLRLIVALVHHFQCFPVAPLHQIERFLVALVNPDSRLLVLTVVGLITVIGGPNEHASNQRHQGDHCPDANSRHLDEFSARCHHAIRC